MTCIPEGNYAFLELLFDTRDASGQNMVDDRRPGRLRLHPRLQPYPAFVRLHRVPIFQGQESQPADAALGPRP